MLTDRYHSDNVLVNKLEFLVSSEEVRKLDSMIFEEKKKKKSDSLAVPV